MRDIFFVKVPAYKRFSIRIGSLQGHLTNYLDHFMTKERDFILRFFDWKSWYEKADYLKESALILHQEALSAYKNGNLDDPVIQRKLLSTISPSLFLSGIAIENLLKAYVIHQFSKEMNPITQKINNDHQAVWKKFKTFKGKYNWNAQGGHGIKEIYKRTGLKLKPEEDRFITRVQRSLIWSGKYLFPNKFTESHLEDFYSKQGYKVNDPEMLEKLFEKIQGLLPEHSATF